MITEVLADDRLVEGGCLPQERGNLCGGLWGCNSAEYNGEVVINNLFRGGLLRLSEAVGLQVSN